MYVTILFTNQIDKYWHKEADFDSNYNNPAAQKNRIRFEEVFHMMTQYGYGLQWPSQFSLDGSTNSTLLKECQKVTCNWWQHPENNCPDKTATSSTAKACTVVEKCYGTCKEASCNCVEWFHQVCNFNLDWSILSQMAQIELYWASLVFFGLDGPDWARLV